jgi:hypothetical protein
MMAVDYLAHLFSFRGGKTIHEHLFAFDHLALVTESKEISFPKKPPKLSTD